MILLDELKSELNSYLPQIKELADVLNIENSKTELEELRNKAAEKKEIKRTVPSRDSGIILKIHKWFCKKQKPSKIK